MHVWTVVGTGAKAGDVELAQLLLFGQLDVMAEVAVVTLVRQATKKSFKQILHTCVVPCDKNYEKDEKIAGIFTQVHLPSM